MALPKLIVFDMDGVLIDVTGSYRETVRRSASIFFLGARGCEALPDPLFPLPDLARLKRIGGLNNDWDLTCQVVSLLFALVDAPPHGKSADPYACHKETIRACDVPRLAAYLKATTSPLMELYERFGRRKDPFVADCYLGDVGTGNILKQIFQEVYLGPDLFRSTYRLEPRFSSDEGLIQRETLLIDEAILADLSRRHILAIATGRPGSEAAQPLKRFSLDRYFRLVLTLDDCINEEERIFREEGKRVSLGKPDPFMLDAVPKRIGQAFEGAFYLGDMPDDMMAAKRSLTGYKGIGVALSQVDTEGTLAEELTAAGADHIIRSYPELPQIVDPD